MMSFQLPRIAFACLLTAALGAAPAWSAPSSGWVSTWTAAPDTAGPVLQPQTIRQVVRTSAGGVRVRVRLSNLFGATPLTIQDVRIALHGEGSQIRPGSDHPLTFGGASSITIAPGQSVLSDALGMAVAPLHELAVSFYLPAGAAPSTLHGVGMQTAYLAPGADIAAAAGFPKGAIDDSRYFLTGVEVAAEDGASAIVVVGDSIVDGVGSTEDSNTRWPDLLADELHRARPMLAVLNAGIAGNRILKDGVKPFVGPSTSSRFGRDVLDQPGVRLVVLEQGINDIVAFDMLKDPAQQASAEQVIEGMRSLIRRAHDRGLQIWGVTLLPYAGVEAPSVHSAEGEAKRQAVNAWIRASGEFDAVLDFDLLMRDPAQLDRLLPRFDSGDHLHPNDAGYRTMAAAAAAQWTRTGAHPVKR